MSHPVLVIPFRVRFHFFLAIRSHSRCHSSCNKLLILFPKSDAPISFETSVSEKSLFCSLVSFFVALLAWNKAKTYLFPSTDCIS